MGTVYEGRHIGTGKRCAIKLLSSPSLNKDLEVVRRFFREARACSALENDHVVEVFDSGIDPESGHPYMVMELLRGEDLEQILKRNAPLEPSVAARLVLQAATGMAKVHETGILHRDIKPANLFLSLRDSGEVVVKILDFGVAKVRVESSLEISSGTLTRTGRLLGTPLYMSPEQIRGHGELDARTDVWSLGVVLFEMLTGASPYSRKSSFGELMVSILTTDLPLLQDVAPWVDPDLAAVTHRALSRALDQRYADAGALRQALASLLPEGSRVLDNEIQSVSERRRTRVASRLSLPAAELSRMTASAPAVETTARSPRRELGVLALAGSLGVLVALATGGVMRARTPLPPVASTTALPLSSQTAVDSVDAAVAVSAAEARTYLVPVAAGVQVEVEGAPVPIENGLVSITGKPGRTFQVRLRQGSLASDVKLVLGADGPVPDRLELAARRGSIRTPNANPSPNSDPPAAVTTHTSTNTAPIQIVLEESTKEFDTATRPEPSVPAPARESAAK